jgi:hypothetical protein
MGKAIIFSVFMGILLCSALAWLIVAKVGQKMFTKKKESKSEK